MRYDGLAMTVTAEKHLIKKYANRKLYDTQTSKYITLDGIAALLREGIDIQVEDRTSGRDITALILAQLVTTEEKRGQAVAEPEAETETAGERGQALLGYVRRTLNVPAALVSTEVGRRRGDLESVIDLAIEQALHRLNITTRSDIEVLTRRIDELARRIDRKSGRASGTATPTRRRKAAAPRR